VTVIKVRVEIEKPDLRLKPGMNATCEFLVARKNDVVAVPNEAVNESPQGAFVEVLVNGQSQRREVKVGLQGNTKTEIIDGLQPGEVVVTGRIFNRQDEGPGSPFGRPFGPRFGSSPRGGQGGPGGGQGGGGR
jgi:multidrug efflux pump subunit AcrA (membrane-fusion protein)